ncbi:MAG: hypothetical protein WC527_02910 [Candidatus Margulisiibacteriota bacterium]
MQFRIMPFEHFKTAPSIVAPRMSVILKVAAQSRAYRAVDGAQEAVHAALEKAGHLDACLKMPMEIAHINLFAVETPRVRDNSEKQKALFRQFAEVVKATIKPSSILAAMGAKVSFDELRINDSSAGLYGTCEGLDDSIDPLDPKGHKILKGLRPLLQTALSEANPQFVFPEQQQNPINVKILRFGPSIDWASFLAVTDSLNHYAQTLEPTVFDILAPHDLGVIAYSRHFAADEGTHESLFEKDLGFQALSADTGVFKKAE